MGIPCQPPTHSSPLSPLQICVVIAAVFGIVIYRVVTVSTFAAFKWALIRNNSQVATTGTAVCINFCIIMLLNVVSQPQGQGGARLRALQSPPAATQPGLKGAAWWCGTDGRTPKRLAQRYQQVWGQERLDSCQIDTRAACSIKVGAGATLSEH